MEKEEKDLEDALKKVSSEAGFGGCVTIGNIKAFNFSPDDSEEMITQAKFAGKNTEIGVLANIARTFSKRFKEYREKKEREMTVLLRENEFLRKELANAKRDADTIEIKLNSATERRDIYKSKLVNIADSLDRPMLNSKTKKDDLLSLLKRIKATFKELE